ncbi:ribosome maturation protein SDO1 [Marchantia polymorpha subsp. ruderalis]|uniref:Ribosome maturation protein SDO1/SBDS C-terminal domain-containing protein n=2 Tax=Marchantia polymorpha TaxID=3197 RepID=A0AAF6BYN5_MARPO|nr:hypothetical protein MARPO_0003s0227 [Marchantia polymorpha]BBN17119.1 hypothetical protein Mp_7g12140 [Marchantia polymorpha subsp. ruderalis]|eukprot:PTQ49358.1 hypothetical protein MARPO_0003s0227 [Marchantia polymorpha]
MFMSLLILIRAPSNRCVALYLDTACSLVFRVALFQMLNIEVLRKLVQALEIIRELTKQFPITRARMRLKLVVAVNKKASLLERLEAWSSTIESEEEANKLFTVVCQIEPGHFRECDLVVRDYDGRLEVASMAVQKEGDGTVDELIDAEDIPSSTPSKIGAEDAGEASVVTKFSESFSLDGAVFGGVGTASRTKSVDGTGMDSKSANNVAVIKQQKCNTCNAEVGDAKQYREHFKSDWHKHNLKRKTMKLPPLSPEECLADTDIIEVVSDLNEYSR